MAEAPSPPLPRFAGEGAESGKSANFAEFAAPSPLGRRWPGEAGSDEGSPRASSRDEHRVGRPTTWVLSDGRAGHEIQSLGIAEALDLTPELKRIAPRGLFAALAPFGPIDPREARHLAPPFPDLLIAAGRRTIPYLRHVKRVCGGRTFTVYVNAPASGPKTADVIVAPRHDGLQGANVIAPLTPANRLTPALLAQTRADPDPRVAALPAPRVALLIGGDSRHHRFSDRNIEELASLARSLGSEGASVMATVSRRTPPRLMAALRAALDKAPTSVGSRPFSLGRRWPGEAGSDEGLGPRSQGRTEENAQTDPAGSPHPTPLRGATFSPWEKGARTFLWEGDGPNPYLSLLACAEAIVVTADSVNMVSEAASTGAPVHVFEPSGGHAKITAFLDGLEAYGAVRRWAGRLEHWSYEPLNSTPAIADAVAESFAEFRAKLATGRE